MTDTSRIPRGATPGGHHDAEAEAAATLPAALRVAARDWPDTEAVVDRDRRVTYEELATLARRAGASLVAAGVQPGDPVAIWAPNSADWIVAFLGIASAGGMLVPLNTRFKGPEAAYILNRSRARVLVHVEEFLGNDYEAMLEGEDLPHIERRIAFGATWDAFVAAGDSAPLLAELDRRAIALGPEDPIDLMFTSGTTGRPKGVVSRHGPTLRAYTYYAENLGIAHGDRYLLSNPLFHSFGAKAGVVAAITAGATVFPVPVYDPAAAADLIESEGITVFPGPPTVYYGLLELPEEKRKSLSSLRLAVTGAASVPVELLRRMREELGFDVVLTAYGLTECGGLVTMCRAGDDIEVVSSTSGRAVPGVELAISGAGGTGAGGSAAEAGPGEAGEVLVRGYPVMNGYFEDAEATAEAIDADGWFHTGDVGVLDASRGLRITDRLKDMYIVGGFNAYPAEIEAALTEMTGVSQAAVIGVPDDRLGEVGVAFVVARRGVHLDPGEVISFARQRLANYKVPRRVEIVDVLPVNASGKVTKDVLRQQAMAARSDR